MTDRILVVSAVALVAMLALSVLFEVLLPLVHSLSHTLTVLP